MSEVVIDPQGTLLVNGEPAALVHCEGTLARVAACCHGRVLEGGLGLGQTRAALQAAPAVESVETVELNADVAALSLEAGTLALGAETKPGAIVNDDVRAVVAAAVGGDSPWDSVFLDLGEDTDAYDDPQFHQNLKALFPNFGARLVMVRQTNAVVLPGWRLASAEQQDDLSYVLIFDRYDPDEGVGTHDTRGLIDIPGYGWVKQGD